jgi:hypothetical protein
VVSSLVQALFSFASSQIALITALLGEVERLKSIIEEKAVLPVREPGSGKPIQNRFSIQNNSDAVSPPWSVSG